MKRLLRISLDTSLLSLMPVLSWFFLSIIVDKNLINVFTLTYPIQFIYYMLKAIFSVGANICKQKENDDYAVGNGFVIAIILGFFIYGFIAINIDNYITFMNLDIKTYHEFGLYSVIQLYIQLLFNFVIEKLYYEGKNKLANKYSVCFNMINFIILILASLIIKNKVLIVIITLLCISIYTIFVLIKERCKVNFKSKIFNFIKYDSVAFFHSLCFFLIFLFGLRTAINYGTIYTSAITFVSLITDVQWDTFDSINTAAKIDISKGNFNYKDSIKNAYKLFLLLLLSIFIMFIMFYKNYDLNIKITFIFLSIELFNFIIYPIYSLKTTFLNLEYNSFLITSNKVLANIGRMFLSILHTPFCTAIGQVVSCIYQFIVLNIIFKKNYYLNNKGYVLKKRRNKERKSSNE